MVERSRKPLYLQADLALLVLSCREQRSGGTTEGMFESGKRLPTSASDMFGTSTGGDRRDGSGSDSKPLQSSATTQYCAKLQQWIWQYYWGYANWQSGLALSAFPPPCSFPQTGTSVQTPVTPVTNTGRGQQTFDSRNWYSYPVPLSFPASSSHPSGAQTGQSSSATPTTGTGARPAQQQNPAQAGMSQVEC